MLESQITQVIQYMEAKEKEYSADYLAALDIDEFEQCLKAQRESSMRVRLIRKWKGGLDKMLREISSYGPLLSSGSGNPAGARSPSKPKEEAFPAAPPNPFTEPASMGKSPMFDPSGNSLSAANHAYGRQASPQEGARAPADPFGASPYGDYVWEKLKNLSDSGHRFTFAELLDLQSKRWSKTQFDMDSSFARVFRASADLAGQTQDDYGNPVYFAEPLEFGGNKLLFASQWTDANKTAFDRWYDGLQKGGEALSAQREAASAGAAKAASSGAVKATFFGKELSFKDRKEAYAKLCETLLLRKPYDIAGFSDSQALNPAGEVNFSYDPIAVGEGPLALKNGLFVRLNLSDAQMSRLMASMLEECGLSPKDAFVQP
jgi:hypothetical protein